MCRFSDYCVRLLSLSAFSFHRDHPTDISKDQNINEIEGERETEAFPNMIKLHSLSSISLIHPSFLIQFHPQVQTSVSAEPEWQQLPLSLINLVGPSNFSSTILGKAVKEPKITCGRCLLCCQTCKHTHTLYKHILFPFLKPNLQW